MTKGQCDQLDPPQGALDMLVLRTLLFGPLHGHSIAHTIQQNSPEVIRVDHGSLDPALQRPERRGWVTADWGTSENNRRARYYRVTRAGRRRLTAESSRWGRLAEAIASVVRPHEGEG